MVPSAVMKPIQRTRVVITQPLESHAGYFHVKISHFLLFAFDLFIFLKTNPAHTLCFLPLLMTILSYEPL